MPLDCINVQDIQSFAWLPYLVYAYIRLGTALCMTDLIIMRQAIITRGNLSCKAIFLWVPPFLTLSSMQWGSLPSLMLRCTRPHLGDCPSSGWHQSNAGWPSQSERNQPIDFQCDGFYQGHCSSLCWGLQGLWWQQGPPREQTQAWCTPNPSLIWWASPRAGVGMGQTRPTGGSKNPSFKNEWSQVNKTYLNIFIKFLPFTW